MFSSRALKQKVMPGGTGGVDSLAPAAYRSCSKFEVSTVQVDSFLQGAAPAGGDAFKGDVSTGIQVPEFVVGNNRFLMILARAKFSQARRVRLVGIRQYASIGATQARGTPVAATTVAAASNGQALPLVAATLNVVSTVGFPAGPSSIVINTAAGPQTFTYTAIGSGTTFTGVNGGTPGVLFTGNAVDSTTPAAGSVYNTYFEKQITSPRWRFPDGNISWHVMALQPNIPSPAFLGGLPVGVTGNITNQAPGFSFVNNTGASSILSLGSSGSDSKYTAPNGGRPFGVPLTPDLGNIHDMRWPWDSANSWHYSLDVPINAPCDIVLYASVQQTFPGGRNNPVVPPSPIPGAASAGFGALGPEDQFMLTFPATSQYWRVAGALVFAENCCEDCK